MPSPPFIHIVRAREHNLKDVNVSIPRGRLTVITGLSGSGKSSLAFDTLYAEGQRRYVGSLSVHARQFMEQLHKPAVDRIEGLCPTIAIEQRVGAAGPRSTVATSTEIYDFLRVLYARAGQAHCWKCGRPIERESVAQIVSSVLAEPKGRRFLVLAPMVRDQPGTHSQILAGATKRGFIRARIDGAVVMLEDVRDLAPDQPHTVDVVVDRLTVKPQIAARLTDDVETAARLSGGCVTMAFQEEDGRWSDRLHGTAYVCPYHPEVHIDALTPQLFSFNSPLGACESCQGLGTTPQFDPELIVPDQGRSVQNALPIATRLGPWAATKYDAMIEQFCMRYQADPASAVSSLADAEKQVLLYGEDAPAGQAQAQDQALQGLIPFLQHIWNNTKSESVKRKLHGLLESSVCPACGGTRLRESALNVRVGGLNIAEWTSMTVAQAARACPRTAFDEERAVVASPLLAEIQHRLAFLERVGVGYLPLSRASESLSGGEWQRIRLATQIGGRLAGVCYVLDEPTRGLHPADSRRLADILVNLTELDNTVVVVEHDEEVINRADYLIDMGPAAGVRGGYVVAAGPPKDVLGDQASLTANYLTGRRVIPLPAMRRTPQRKRAIRLLGVEANNLRALDVTFPLGCFICVTGVSGSGKSTLVHKVLLRVLRRNLRQGGARPGTLLDAHGLEHVARVIEVDQAPIGRTPRSVPATYVGLFDLMRKLYAKTREAKVRGYDTARFSFNVKGGRCEHCEGQGVRRVSMHFLPDVFVTCTLCHGRRFNAQTLEVRYRGKSIADALGLSVDEAVPFFDSFANMRQRVVALQDVGLGYMSLGQPSTTLSGGEAQRIKLAAELHKQADGHTMYILDEPTTGLHFEDVRNLLTVLNRLVDRGDTVVVVEHNLDVIKSADWIIDLGPGAGDDGGGLVACGTPEQVAQCPDSHTGRYLRTRLTDIGSNDFSCGPDALPAQEKR